MGPNPSNQQPPETPANTLYLISRICAMENPALVAFFRQAQKLETELLTGSGSAWAIAKINAQNAAEEIRRRAAQKKRQESRQPQPQTLLQF